MSVRAFALGMCTGPACFDTEAIRPSLAGGGAHFEAGVLHGGGPSASAVAACLAPAAPAPEVFGINLALAATAAIGVLGGAVALARNSTGSNRRDSSVSDSSVSEGARGGDCRSQEPPNCASPGGTVEAATAACADGVGFGAVIEPPLPLDPGGGRATACLSRARGGRRGRHEGQMARGQEGKGTPTIAMTV